MTERDLPRLGGKTGAYLLAIRLQKSVRLEAGALAGKKLGPGIYLYAGSAYGPGGLAARVKRHFRQNKKHQWHVDALTMRADQLAAYPVENGKECVLVERVLAAGGFRTAMDGFGSTDCSTCKSHLLLAR